MRKIILVIVFFLLLPKVNSQLIGDEISLDYPILDETSGLIFYNNNLITHNDSGGEASLYEIDATTGLVKRIVTVNNALNVDWEDIAQDDFYIYIGDIGNNLGNRTDLKIYKISKEDYNDGDDNVTPEIISYSYDNQLDFSASLNNNNWDAESLISYGENLLIFSKNWVDRNVNVYAIPKVSGAYEASLEGSYNVNGLITGADISIDEETIYLIGYNDADPPFMYTIQHLSNDNLNVFSGVVSEKISNLIPVGNQVEAISFINTDVNKHRLYVSNEKFTRTVGTIEVNFPAKLRLVEIEVEKTTLALEDVVSDKLITIYPNPFDNKIQFNKKIDKIIVFDSFGRIVAEEKFIDEMFLENLSRGVYIIFIELNGLEAIKKIVKE